MMPRRDGSAPRSGIRPKIASEHEIRFTGAARKAKALRKLGVSEDQVASVPQVTPLLRDKRRSLKPMLFAMYLSQDPVVHTFLDKRASLDVWAQENTPWEAIALAAGIDTPQLLGVAILAMREYGKFVAMNYYPEVIKKRVELALLPGGWRDRDAIDKLVGSL